MIDLETRDAVTILRMVRGKGNALDLDFLVALSGARGVGASSTRAVVLTGQGSAFGAGSICQPLSPARRLCAAFFPANDRSFEHLATFPKPLVAAVNGHAIAGGAIVMLACDQRLLARNLPHRAH